MDIDLDRLQFRRAAEENIDQMLTIIHRCMMEVNRWDYPPEDFSRYLGNFTRDWLADIIRTRHYYEAWHQGELIACGGVSRDLRQKRQSYLTAIFVNPDCRGKGVGRVLVRFLEDDAWCLDSDLIEVPSSRSAHRFYVRCGYRYRTEPPVFSEADGSTILYKRMTPRTS